MQAVGSGAASRMVLSALAFAAGLVLVLFPGCATNGAGGDGGNPASGNSGSDSGGSPGSAGADGAAGDEGSNDSGGANAAGADSGSNGGGFGSGGGASASVELTSDDFNAEELDPVWSFVDPLGDASYALLGVGSGHAVLEIVVPAGTAHNPWQMNQAPRLMQWIGDVDFSVEAKFDSDVSAAVQTQGLVAELDEQNFIRLDLFSDGSATRIFAAAAVDGTMQEYFNETVAPETRYLRLVRDGSNWTAGYSADGLSWSEEVVEGDLSIRGVGVMAGNAGDNPEHRAHVDYFFDTENPVDPEDPVACEGEPPYEIELEVTGNGSVSVSPEGPYACNQLVELTAEPDAGHYFVGWSGDANGADLAVSVAVTGDLAITAEFTPPSIFVWYGETQSFGQLGEPQTHVNILGTVVGGSVESMTYALNGGEPVPTSTSPEDNARIAREGNFTATVPFADLTEGNNTLELVAQLSEGELISEEVSIDYSPGNTWPFPYTADFTDSGVSAISELAQVVDGWWALEPQGLRTLETGYDRLITLGDASWIDYEILAEVVIHEVIDESNPSGFGIAARWPGHTGLDSPPTNWYPLGCIGMYRYRSTLVHEIFEPDGAVRVQSEAPLLTLNQPYMLKLRIESQPDDEVWCGFRVWPKSDDEPADWSIEVVSDTDGRAPPGGSVLLIAHHVDLSFSSVSVTPIDR